MQNFSTLSINSKQKAKTYRHLPNNAGLINGELNSASAVDKIQTEWTKQSVN